MVIDGICVHVVRKRIKNMNLRITSAGEVHLSVPYGVGRDQIEAMVRKHRTWILRNQARVQQRSALSERRFAEGEKLYVWGVPRTIVIADAARGISVTPAAKPGGATAIERPGSPHFPEQARQAPDRRTPHPAATQVPGSPRDAKPQAILSEDHVTLVLPQERRDSSESSVAYRRQLVLELFAREVRQEVERVYPGSAAEVGTQATSITVRYMTSRWGSCTPSTRRIRLNSALAAYDPQCLRQVLIHELCHIYEPNHGPRFWALMDQHCPDWRTWQAELKSRGPLDAPQA